MNCFECGKPLSKKHGYPHCFQCGIRYDVARIYEPDPDEEEYTWIKFGGSNGNR